jgi:hypothetical protein
MKKKNLFAVFVLVLALTIVFTLCHFGKKKNVADNPKNTIERVTLMCFVKGAADKKMAHWIFTQRTPLACPNWSDPYIVKDSIYLWILNRLDYTGIAKVQIDGNYSSDALYFLKFADMKMTKTNEVYVSYGGGNVVQYGMINNKLYIKKITADELIAMFPKNIRDVLSNLGVYVLNK